MERLRDLRPRINNIDQADQVMAQIANSKGHVRQLVERLKTASRIANKAGEKLDNQHFSTAVRLRAELAKNNPRIKA